MKKKKGIGPVVAMALLVVTTVLAVVAFQSWYATYSSVILSKSEANKDDVSTTKIESAFGNELYFRNSYSKNLTVTGVKLGGFDCNITTTLSNNSLSSLDISSCRNNITTNRVEAVIYTSERVYSSWIYFDSINTSTTVSETIGNVSLSFSSNATIINYNDSINLSWIAVNATSCTGSGDWSGSKTNGTNYSVQSNLVSNSNFSLYCSNSEFSINSTINVTVCEEDYSNNGSDCIAPEAPVYSLSNSLRLNDDDNAYLSRVLSPATNVDVHTVSMWVKRSELGAQNALLESYNSSSAQDFFRFDNSDRLEWRTGAGGSGNLVSTAKFRDTSTWYHIIFQYNSTETTSSNRVNFFVDGVQLINFDTETYPTQNRNSELNSPQSLSLFYDDTNNADAFDGYISEVHFIDGQALGPENFGENDSYGNWIPKEYNGTYGINGFYLPFNTSVDLGRDLSGNEQSVIISQGTGTVIGDMTQNGGNAAAFDGTQNPVWTSAAYKEPANDAYIGKNWGSGNEKRISRYIMHSASGSGFEVSYNNNINFTLQGSVDGSSWINLHSDNFSDTSGILEKDYSTGIDNSTAYQYHRVLINSSTTAGTRNAVVGEVIFYEVVDNDFTTNNIEEAQGLLIHSNTTDNSTLFVDSSGRGHSITSNGDVYHNTSQSKFGNSSIYFDGSTDYLSITGNDDFNIYGNDFTIDFWLKTTASADAIMDIYKSSSAYYSTRLYLGVSGTIQPIIGLNVPGEGGSGTQTFDGTYGTTVVNDGAWHHIALVSEYSGNSVLYVDGVADKSATTGTRNTALDKSTIGSSWYNSGYDTEYFNGYIDELRITKGKALWTTNFTPPTQPATVLNSPANDQVIDTPTNNYATFNSIDKDSTITLSEGNLKLSDSGASDSSSRATLGVSSGKWYWEAQWNAITAGVWSGVGTNNFDILTGDLAASSDTWVLKPYTGYKSNGDGDPGTSYGSAFSTGDIMMVALDMDNQKIWWGRNGTWFNSGIPESGTNWAYSNLANETLFPLWGNRGSGTDTITFNFGQLSSLSGTATTYNSSAGGSFVYTPPTGFKALSVNNINNVTGKVNASEYFDTILYTGTGAERNITSLAFSPDLVWIKNRDTTDNHILTDSMRGTTKIIYSNLVNTEDTQAEALKGFISNGFTLGNWDQVNTLNENYVAWNWKANSTEVSVAQSGTGDGSYNGATYRANKNSGFSIINYTGYASTISNGQSTRVTHGLDDIPKLMIIKSVDTSQSWAVLPGKAYHGAWSIDNHLKLDTSDASSGSLFVQPAFPTSTYVQIGNDNLVNKNGDEFLMYAFSEVEGFSKIGIYTGNGDSDGPFVYTGFKPSFVMLKEITNSATHWRIFDSARNQSNPITARLFPNLNSAEDNWEGIDFNSNGFKIRGSGGDVNLGSANYIYIAFADKPLK